MTYHIAHIKMSRNFTVINSRYLRVIIVENES